MDPAKPKGKLTAAGTFTDCPASNESAAGSPMPLAAATGTLVVKRELTIVAGQPWGKIAFNSGTTGAKAGGNMALSTGGGITAAAGADATTLLTNGPVVSNWFSTEGSCK